MSRSSYKTYLRSKGRRTPPPSAVMRSSNRAEPGHLVLSLGQTHEVTR